MFRQHTDYKFFAICISAWLLFTCSVSAGNTSMNFPALFMKNEGQFGNGSRYCLKSAKSNTFFYDQHIVHQFFSEGNQQDSSKAGFLNMHIDFENSNPHPVFEERDAMETKSNFFIGNDPSAWKTDIASFGTLAYKELYDNIDLVYHNSTHGIKSDFVIHPGGNHSDIILNYSGIKTISINAQGALQILTENGDLTEHIPEAYQLIDGEKVLVRVTFSITSGNRVSFEVSDYNPSYDLVIDPQLIYSTYIGGSGNDYMLAGDIERDASNNIYLTGRTTSFDFPVTPGSFSNTEAGLMDVIVMKLNPEGTQILFSTFIGGTGNDMGYGLELTGVGNDIVIVGDASYTFPTTAGSYRPVYQGGTYDIFVLKLNNAGNNLLFSTFLGGAAEDQPFDLALDNSQNIYVVGQSSGSFPTTPGCYQSLFGGGLYDIIVSELSADGTSLLKSTYVGGTSTDRGVGITVDVAGNVYFSGTTSGSFPVTAGCFDNSYNGGTYDIVVGKLNSSFSTLIYSTFIGTTAEDQVRGDLFVDNSSNLLVAGKAGNGFPTTSACAQPVYGGGLSDGLILKLNATGSGLIYSSYLGGNGDDYILNAALDANLNIITTGFCGSGFPVTTCSYDNSYNGNTDAFVAKFNPDVTQLIYSTYFGGSNLDNGMAVTAYNNDSVFVVGETQSADLPVTANAYDPTFNGGGNDLFLAKLLLTSGEAIASFTSPDTVCVSQNITVQNTSSGCGSYYWNFCSGNLATTPLGLNIGNLGSLSGPVYSALAKDGNNYFVFITNITDGTLTRLAFGNNLTNNPVATNLGALGVLVHGIEGIQVEQDTITGNWFGLIAGGSNNNLFRLSFGSSLNNIPVAVNLGNIGSSLSYAHTIYTFREGGNWYGFVGDYDISTIIRLNFGNSLTNTPTATSLGNIGGLSGPVGFYPIKDNGTWYLFVVNRNSSSLSRLNFGISLLNTPTGVNLGNIGGAMNTPRSITLLRDCGKVTGFVVNEIPNDIVRLTFPGGLLSVPSGASLGNIANFSFPHHISELFRVVDSLYTFVMNVNNNTISRLCFPSCTNASVSSSVLQTPPSFSYNVAGTYNISLVVNEGLPGQSNACREIVVLAPPSATITGNTNICSGATLSLGTNASQGYSYQWTGPNGYTSTSQNVVIPNATSINSGIYTLIVSQGGCPGTPATATVTVSSPPAPIAGPDITVCETVVSVSLSGTAIGASASTTFSWGTSGTGSFSNLTILNPVYTPSNADKAAGSATLTLTASTLSCTDVSDALLLTFSRVAVPYAGPDNSTCQSQPFTVSGASAPNSTSFTWSKIGTGNLLNITTLTPTYIPGAGETGLVTLTLTANSTLPCQAISDIMLLNVNPSPSAFAGMDESICAGSTYIVSGASASNNISFFWTEDGTGNLINTAGLTPTYVPGVNETGMVTITLTATGNAPCAMVSGEMHLNILAPVSVTAGPDGTICSGSTYTISGATVTNAASYFWSSNGAGSLFPPNSLSPTYTPGTNETGIVTFTLMALGNIPCPSAQSQTTLTIIPAVTADAGPDESVCKGNPFTVASAFTTNAVSLAWSKTGTGTLSGSTSLSPTYTPGPGETGWVTLTLQAAGTSPCPVATDVMHLFIQDTPTAFAGQNASICQNTTYTIPDASATNFSTYSWTEDGPGFLSGTNSMFPTYHPVAGETGNVTITLISNGIAGCPPLSHSMTLTINPLPTAFAGPDEHSCQGFTFTVTGAGAQYQNSVDGQKTGQETFRISIPYPLFIHPPQAKQVL